MLMAVVFKHLQKYGHYEYTPILLILGIVFGIFFESLGYLGLSYEYVSRLDGHTLLLVFIPLLIFESAFNADTYTFMKSLRQIVLLAFPAVVMSIFLIALTLMYGLGYKATFNWGMALSLSSILAATDPVAVVAILKSTGAQIKLNMLIEGESLLNDGSAAIFFFVFVDMIKDPVFSFGNFVVKFLRLTFGGIGLGLLLGFVSNPLFKMLRNEKLVVVMSLKVAYLTFFLAESQFLGLHVSGILAVVVLGLFLGAYTRPKLKAEAVHTLHAVWGSLGLLMETVLFLLTGGYIGVFLRVELINAHKPLISGMDVLKLVIFNVLLLAIRYLVIGVWWPLLNCCGYKISWKEYLIMGYSGLRGAIGLAIGLNIALNESFPEDFRILTVLYISGVILFTVLVQGLTLKHIMKAIGYNRMSSTKKRLFRDLQRRLFLNILEKSGKLHADKKVSFGVCWESLYQIFKFPRYVLDLNNIDTQGKPLLMDFNYHDEIHERASKNIPKEDFLISDDETLQRKDKQRHFSLRPGGSNKKKKRFISEVQSSRVTSKKDLNTFV